MPNAFYSSFALYPIKGKPIILRQLENLKNTYGMERFILVINRDNDKLVNYAKKFLTGLFDLKIVLSSGGKTILHSLSQGLLKADRKLPTRVILGDTMIARSIDGQTDVIYTSPHFRFSQNWCLTDLQGSFFDKQKDADTGGKEALVGYYSFSDTPYLIDCCADAIKMRTREISNVLVRYQKRHALSCRTVDDWYDLGHTAGIVKAKSMFYSARNFNSIAIDPDAGLFIKSSDRIQKLTDEVFWYANIPERLKVFTPRVIAFEAGKEQAVLTQELYGYPTLQDLYLSGDVNVEDWEYIIERLFVLHKSFDSYKGGTTSGQIRWLYWDKTVERVRALCAQDKYWKGLAARERETINSREYAGLAALRQGIERRACELAGNASSSVIHGDYCFSNILFDPSNFIFKLVDPRGRLQSEQTVFGDPRYDIAKLRHSVCGMYDFIVSGLFAIKERKKGFEYRVLTPVDYSGLEAIFDDISRSYGYNPEEIRFIEGLLFLSMIDLHGEDFRRQQAFYLRAVELLNPVS